MKTDSLFYRLFKNAPELLFELADIKVTDAHRYRFCSEEIKQTAFRLDGIMTPPQDCSDSPIVFVEVQFQRDNHFYSRFFCEIFFFLHQNHPAQPWQAVVIYPNRQSETDGNLHYDTLIASKRLKRIYLDEFIDPPKDRLGLQLIRLIISDEHDTLNNAQDLLKCIKLQTDTHSITHWLDWIETILVYKLPTLSREEIQHMLGYNDISLKQTRFYQDVFSEGLQQGLQQGESQLLLRQLKRRLGSLDTKTLIAIQQLPQEQIESLADALFELTTIEQLHAWLAHYAK